MKKANFILTLFTFLSVFSSCAKLRSSEGVVLVPEEYGAIAGDSTFDNGVAFQRMLADAREYGRQGREVRVDLGDKTYHIYPDSLRRYELFISNHDHVSHRAVAFYVDSMEHFTIRGAGASLLFHGRQIPFVVRRSRDVKLEGFGVNYPRPAMSQVEVLSVEGDDVRVKVLEETNYRIEDNKFILEGEGYEQQLFVTMPFGADKHMKWGRADVAFDPKMIMTTADGTLTLQGWAETPYLHEGDRYVLRSYYRPTPGIVLMDAESVTVSDVAVHYAEGMALVAQNTRDIELSNFRVDIAEGSDRYFTTQADATHFSGCRGSILSHDGLYEHMADDAINVHGTYLRVDSIVHDGGAERSNTVVASFAHNQSFGYTWFEEGDSIRFIDRRTLLPVSGALAADVQVLSPTQVMITITSEGFDTSIWGEKPVAVENLSAYPEVKFVHNTVRNNRARGALFSTPRRVLCEGNFFDHTHGSAILLCGDANGWYESGPCEDVLIRYNSFLNALTAKYQFTYGVISIAPEIPELVHGQPYHGRIVVENNEFDTFGSPLYYVKSVREFVDRGNKVKYNEDYKPLFENTESKMIEVGTAVLP